MVLLKIVDSIGFDISQSKISLETTIEINLEPIVLSSLSESGLPFSFYYGACGRVAVFSYEGSNLVSYLYSSFQFRLLNHEDPNEIRNVNSHSTTINIENESTIADFLKEIDSIRLVIDRIDEHIQEVKRIHAEMLKPMANSKLEQELDDKMKEIKKLSYETATKLKRMEQLKDNRSDHDKMNAQRRIKESQIFVLTRRLRDTMIQYNEETDLHRERCKKIIVRELAISGNRRSDNELEEMLESDFPGSFNISIFVDTQKARQSLDECEARRRDIIKLETSIKELHSMFNDLAILVRNQGEMIDCIEHNVSKAIDHVEQGAENVKIANEYNEKATKKKIILLIVFVISIIVILMIVLLGYFTQRKVKGR